MHPFICFAAGLLHDAGMDAEMMWVWILMCVLLVLDGALPCAVSRRSQMIYFVLAASMLGLPAERSAILNTSLLPAANMTGFWSADGCWGWSSTLVCTDVGTYRHEAQSTGCGFLGCCSCYQCCPCISCDAGEYREYCGDMDDDAGECYDCDSCPDGMFRSGCGGDDPGICLTAPSPPPPPWVDMSPPPSPGETPGGAELPPFPPVEPLAMTLMCVFGAYAAISLLTAMCYCAQSSGDEDEQVSSSGRQPMLDHMAVNASASPASSIKIALEVPDSCNGGFKFTKHEGVLCSLLNASDFGRVKKIWKTRNASTYACVYSVITLIFLIAGVLIWYFHPQGSESSSSSSTSTGAAGGTGSPLIAYFALRRCCRGSRSSPSSSDLKALEKIKRVVASCGLDACFDRQSGALMLRSHPASQ